MPKFSAYMRGQKGATGPSGQASLYDGIVDTPNDLPNRLKLPNDKNYAYYVEDGGDGTPHLYILKKNDINWTDLGSIRGPKGDTGDAAGFSTTINVSSTTLPYNKNAFVSITTDPNSPNTNKVFNFNFGIPTGEPAGFSNIQNATASSIDSNLEPSVSITTKNDSPDTQKQFNFHFNIPKGEAAGFGEPTISVEKIEPTEEPEAIITAEGESREKIFNFHFKIPQGYKGDRGDSFAAGEGISFTAESEYWSDNTLIIPRGQEQKVPIFIKNLDDDSIIRDFIFDTENNQIIYEANEPFNGRLYSVVENDRTVTINSVTTVDYGEGSRVDTNENSTSSNLLLDFVLERGPQGLTGKIGDPIISVSTVSSTSEPNASIITTTSEIDNSKIFNFHFDIPKGEKGETGDAMSAYEGVSFTTGSEYWENAATLIVPRGSNKKIPLFVLNNDKKSIAATFELDDDYIYHQADEKFDGTIYMVGPRVVEMPNIAVGTINTVDYGEGSNVIVHSNTTDYNVTLDFTLERGPQPLNLEVRSTRLAEIPYVNILPVTTAETTSVTTFYLDFGIPKGEKGDTFTVEVDRNIQILNPTEEPIVETTNTSTGIQLKFSLPPTMTDTWGPFAKAQTISLSSNNIVDILPISKGGTSATTAANARANLELGSLAIKDKLVHDDIPNLNASKITAGTLNADRIPNLNASKITEGILSIERGGTGTTTLTGIRGELFSSNLNTTAQYLIGVQQDYAEGGYVKLPLPVVLGGIGVNTATANMVFAAPNGSNGAPSFRKLVANDIPTSLGNMTFTGTVTLTKTTDISGTAANAGALIVGGTQAQPHLEFDCNEIIAKTNGTSVADLWINSDGGAVHVGSGGFASGGAITANDTITASGTIYANSGLKIGGSNGTEIKGIKVTNTDPGEGSSLTNGWLLFVYE